MVGPQRRSSSVASSCVSSEFGDLLDGQSPGKTNGLGKSPATSMTSSPQTPAGLEKSGSPSAMKKRRSSIGGAEDLARGLDFGTTSPSTEEKKHPFLTRGGGHKKVSTPAAQTSSPAKKATTPPGKEKLAAVRSTLVSTLSPRKSFEAKKDIMSPRRSVLGSEGVSMNGSLISEGTSNLVDVTPKKASPRAALEGKVSAGKPSPRSIVKPVASTKGRKNSNGDSAAIIDSSPSEVEAKFSPVKTPDVKISSLKSPDVKTKKSSPQSPVPSLKFRPGLTSPKSQKSAKTRQNTPSHPGRAKTRTEKAVRTENLHTSELDSVAVPVSPENEIQAKSENVVVDKMEGGSTLLPSLMVDGNVGDEDMSSLDQGGDPGFDNDTDMPTSWLSEDLPCMFSSLSRLPEPDDSSSSHFGDPPEFLEEPYAVDTKQKSSELANPKDVIDAAEVKPRSSVAGLDEEFVAAGFPSETSKEVGESEWNYESRTFSLLENSYEAELGNGQAYESNELESQQPSPFPAVVEPVAVSQGERIPCKVTTHPEETSSSSNGSTFTQSVASLSRTENMLTEERNLQFPTERRTNQPIPSQGDEEPAVESQVALPNSLGSNGGVYHFKSLREMDTPYSTSALPEEERWTTAEDEVSATQDDVVILSSDDESTEDFIEGTCGAQLNLKQSFDDAAEPAAPHNEVEGTRDALQRDSRQDTHDVDLEPTTAVALSTNGKILPDVTEVTESEFVDESQNGHEPGTFTQTHFDKDMMIFDFEEYWTQNAGDESFHSDAGPNDAEDLQLYSMRETQLPSPVIEIEAEKSVPVNELPVSILPGNQFIKLEPESSDQLGVTPLDSHGWLRTNSSAPIPASNASEMDSKSADQEFDEVFHPFEGSDHLSSKAVSVDNLSSPEKPTVELNQEPNTPRFSQSKIASEPATSASPKDTPLETAHSNGVDIGQLNQNLDVSEDKDAELEVAEHQKSSVHTFMAQESSVADLYSPKTAVGLGNNEARVDQESVAQEDIDSQPIPSVTSNGILSASIHHLDDKDHASYGIMELEGLEDPKFSPVNMQVLSQKSSFETPALADAYLSDDSSEMGPENLSVTQVPEVRAISVQTTETTDDRDATETNEFMPDASHSAPNRDIASPIAGASDSHDLVSSPVDSSKLMVAERDLNILSAGEEEDPLESHPPAISLPPMNEISEEEQTEAMFLLSLGSKEDSNHGEDSSTDHEVQVNQSQEKPQGQDEIIKDLDSDLLAGGDIISEPIDKFQDRSTESREGATELPKHDDIQILPGEIISVEERPLGIQSQADENIKSPALKVESYGETVNEFEVDRQSQMPLISTPKTLQGDSETPDLVPSEHALPAMDHGESRELISVARSPVSDQAEEILNDKFDSKSEVVSGASLHESDEGTHTLITAPGATVTDTTSPSKILGTSEIIQSPPEATPPTLSDGKLSNLTLNEADEFDDKLGNEVTVDKERWRTVSDSREQISTTEHGWEEPVQTTDSNGSKSSTRNLFRQESMVTHAGNSAVTDDANDPEIDMDVSEVTSKAISSPVSTPDETIEYHDPDFQEIHRALGKSISTDYQVSRSEDALETEKVLVASSYASIDDSDDHAIKDVEIVPEHFSSKDLPFERLVAPNQQIFHTAISDVDEVDSEITPFKEAENSNKTLEPIPPLKDEDLVVESPKNSFIHSSQDAAKNIYVEEKEGASAPQLTLPPEMKNADSFALEKILWSPPEQLSTEEAVLEDEEMVVYSPKISFVASGTPDTTILADIDCGNLSHVSRTASKGEESFNGNLEEVSLPNDEFVHTPKDRINFAAPDLNTTTSGGHGTQAVSLKDENEASALVGKPLHEDEDTAVASPKKFSVVSGEDTAVSDVDELEAKSWKSGKEEMSLNGSLVRGEETTLDSSKDQVVSSGPMSQSDIPAGETPEISTSDVHDIQNHWNNLRSGESLNGVLKGEPLPEDDDTVVHKATGVEIIAEESSPKGVENVVNSNMEILKAPEDTVAYGHTAESLMKEGFTYVGKAVDSPTEASNVLKDTVVCRPSVGDSTPELLEESSRESMEPVADRNVEIFTVPEHNATNAAKLIVEEQESERDDKGRESCNGNLERESKIEVEKNSEESFIAPDLPNANFISNLAEAEESEKETDKEETLDQRLDEKSSSEVEQPMVETFKESSVSIDRQTATNTSIVAVAQLEKQTLKEDETLDQRLDEKSSSEVEQPMVETFKESSVSIDRQTATNTSNVAVAQLEKQTLKEDETLDQRLDEKSSSEVEQPMVETFKESSVSIDRQTATNTSNVAVAQLEKQTLKEDEALDQSLDSDSPFEAEETALKSSEKELFVAPDLVKAKDSSNLAAAEKLEEDSDKEEETVDHFLDTKSTFEVEEPVVESSEKESFVASDVIDAKSTSHLFAAEELEKQTDEEESLDRSLEAKSMNEAEETKVESSEKESYIAPGLLDAKYSSNFVATDQLEKQTDKKEKTLDQSSEVKSPVEVEQTMKDSTIQTFVAPDLLNAKLSSTVVADELEEQTNKEEENLEEKSTLEVAEMVVGRSKETLVVSDAVAETLGAEDLDNHPTPKTPSKEGESSNAINLEKESIQDTVVTISSDNVKKELEYLSEEDVTQSSSGPTNLGANLVASNLNLTDEGAKEPHSSPIADAVNADGVNNSLDVSEVVQKDAVAKDSEEFSKPPAAKEECYSTNGEKFSKVPAAEEEICMTNGEKPKDSNGPVHETADTNGITVPTNPQADATPESTEPRSPTATLYPLSKPPFSGSLQDRLWEEQAEAYNSGQGTPSRNEDHATQNGVSGVSSSPKEKLPTSSEDQIQPVAAAAASNGNHAVVVGTSNGAAGHENGSTPVQDQSKGIGKEKLHTPLRSLLLEESSHAGSLTPNGVNGSPSFIRRLFRVMSTSRSVEKEASQGKLKKSSSMWVSCLGSPQVQQ